MWTILIILLAAWLPSACTWFTPVDPQRDLAAEEMVVKLRQTNVDLTGFKCVGKMSWTGSRRPLQSFRVAIAGQLSDRLRIDMFAPFGGSAGTVSSNGKNLFLVRHSSREYFKRRYGKGSLRRLIGIDIKVSDLLEMLVGRIPIQAGAFARMKPSQTEPVTHLVFVDRWSRLRQRITFDDTLQPVRSEWFDNNQDASHTLTLSGRQVVNGFVLPRRIELAGTDGERVAVWLDRYEANASMDESLFVVAPPSS